MAALCLGQKNPHIFPSPLRQDRLHIILSLLAKAETRRVVSGFSFRSNAEGIFWCPEGDLNPRRVLIQRKLLIPGC